MKALADGVSGAVFGAGLVLSGMTRPEKVIGFLDVTGAWDPSLALVMVGALVVHGLVLWAWRPGTPAWLGETRVEPPRRAVDARLVLGAALFGVGWGLAGYCPGPALVGATVTRGAALFTAAMVVGMALYAVVERARQRATASARAEAPAETAPGPAGCA